MLYAILCYSVEEAVGSWTRQEEDTVMAKLAGVQQKLAKQGRLGPVARLMPTSAATTLRKGSETVIMDGPFAETKEQLLGFYLVDCATPAEAETTARELAAVNPAPGGYEIRPLKLFHSGSEADVAALLKA